MSSSDRRLLRIALPVLATVAIVAPLAWLWQASRVPSRYSVMEMGYHDYGGGAMPDTDAGGHGSHGQWERSPPGSPRLVTDMVADPARPADVRVELVTRQQMLTVGGRSMPGFTVNGTSPGPEIRALQGQLIEVRLRNESVADGVTLHWHGVDVPNAMDGVAGVTQDAVPVGGEFSYRFVADQAGSYWYHSHQVSNPQVAGGLLGSLVVLPKSGIAQQVDVTAVAHTYGGVRTINEAEDLRVPAKPGRRCGFGSATPTTVDENLDQRVLPAARRRRHRGHQPHRSVRSLADPHRRCPRRSRSPVPDGTARIQLSRATAVIIGPQAPTAVVAQPAEQLDLLSYGSPAPLGFDPAQATRRFEYRIGRRPGFVKGRPGMWWSINGHLYPNVPMFVVREGDVTLVHIENRNGEVRIRCTSTAITWSCWPALVAATGSPWWVDSLNVAANETYDIAFVADNPGIWMDHCHNLKHAAQGMIAHLMYEGFDTPYRIAGPADNQPE